MKKSLTQDGVKAIFTPFFWKFLFVVCFFIAAGRFDIFRAWLFFGIVLTGDIVVAVVLWKLAPEVANQRASIKEGTKPWDKIFLAVYFFVSLIAFSIVAGLDIGRFQWSLLPMHYAIIGVAFYVMCISLICWAIVVNRFFEATVRIQKERGHHVISSGPYHFVRHPGYLALIFGGISASFILGSLYSLIPGVIAIIALLVRTYLEDRTLHEELEGYREYASRVRWRLIPGIW